MQRPTLLASAPVLAVALAATACDPAPAPGAPPTSAAAPPAPTTPAGNPAPATDSAKSADLPDFTGMGLQAAQDKAQAAGFYSLVSHDALGRSRHQILDRDWKVCSQTPTSGPQPTRATVDMAAVKLDETCPATDQGAATPPAATAGSPMPDLKGKSMASARTMLPGNTGITTKDATQSRMVLVESNWQVCSQDPAPGTVLNGQPVTLRVTKFGETCP